MIFYTRIVKEDFVCFILIAHFFSFILLFNEYSDDKKINVIKVYIFTFILDTGLNSHAYKNRLGKQKTVSLDFVEGKAREGRKKFKISKLITF